MKFVLATVAMSAALVGLSAVAQEEPTTLSVYGSNGVRSLLEDVKPRFADLTGTLLGLELSTARTLKDRLERGERFDVAILTPDLLDALVEAGKVRHETRIEFARVGIGVGVRPGFPAADLAGPEDLRRILLEAESIAYGATGQSRETNEAAFESLGITELVRPKVRLTGPAEAPRLVASGEVDLVLTLVSELVREPGLRYVGPLPDDLQGYIYFAAGMAVEASEPAAARALLDFLSSAEVAGALGAHGLEPTEIRSQR